MSARLGCYLPRISQLRVFGPLFDELLARSAGRVEPVVLMPGWPISKRLQQPNADWFPAHLRNRMELITLESPQHLLDLVAKETIQAFVTVCPQIPELNDAWISRLRAESAQRRIPWIALPYLFSQDDMVVAQPQQMLDRWDVIGTVGPRSIEHVLRQLDRSGVPAAARDGLRERLTVMGYLELDAVPRLPDPSVLRAKHRLPLDRPIIFLSTAPRLAPLATGSLLLRGLEQHFCGLNPSSPRDLFGWLLTAASRTPTPYRHYLRALRRFADRNDALIVAKSRSKHQDPAYVTAYVDRLIGDESYYPFTTLELMRISSLYFGFLSTAALEAIAVGLYSITAAFVPVELTYPQPASQAWVDWFLRQPGACWNTAGVSALLNGMDGSAEAALERLANARLHDYQIDARQRAQFLDRYLSYHGSSGPRTADVLSLTLEQARRGRHRSRDHATPADGRSPSLTASRIA